MNYLGHINAEDNSEQSLKNHLIGVSKLTAFFTEEFEENEIGKIIGLYHDIGKYSQDFQKYIRHESNKKVDHSTAGARELFNLKSPVNLPAAFGIAGHHGGIPDIGEPKISDETTFFARVIQKKIPDYEKYLSEIEKPTAKNISKLFPLISKKIFSVMFYTRMIFSCLVDADFLDTENFMSKGKIQRGNFSTLEELKKIFDNYIEKTFLNENITRYNEPVNLKRRQILKECIGKGDSSTANVLSLTVPTGGGKTIASMAFALHNAIKNGRKRIIYVIPYTSIIEQNAKVFSDIFGNENVVEHHSGAEYDDTIKKLAAENWDAPIIVTTNIQFFESVFSNRPSKCRKLHSIANSVLIFDEAQMIPTEFLKPCAKAINELTKYYNCTAVLCTATQPSLEKFFDVNISEICSNVEENYNFFRRTQINVLDGKFSVENLSEQLKKFSQVLCIVNKKKTAGEIFESLQGEEKIFYLSTNLCPVHRSKVLKEIKYCLEKNLPCRVISTSLVEAGVDLDFPCVYRELAGLDSIIQAAGRCNREGKISASESFVYIFQIENEKPVQSQKLRINAANLVCEKYFSDLDSPQAIKYYFETLHKLDGSKLDKFGILQLHEKKSMPFKEIAEKFKLITENTKSVFIPFDGNSRQIETRLLNGEISRTLLRKAGKYIVNVYCTTYEKMLAAQKIKLTDESLSVLVDLNLYDSNTGLNQNVEDGIGIFF